jgi:hypothetical protein
MSSLQCRCRRARMGRLAREGRTGPRPCGEMAARKGHEGIPVIGEYALRRGTGMPGNMRVLMS